MISARFAASEKPHNGRKRIYDPLPFPRVERRPRSSAVTAIDFLTHDKLLGPNFEGPSWDRWRAVTKAAFALRMARSDLRLFREVSGDRDPPTKRVRELVCCVGRGGGKDSIAAALATYISVNADLSRLRPGEKGTVLLLAVDRLQAKIAFSYIRGYFESSPTLNKLVRKWGDSSLELVNGAEIIVGTNSMRSVRGRTYIAVIFDECAFYVGEGYASPDVEVDAAVTPGLLRFPGSLKILISSVHKRSGLLYDKYARYFGKNDDDVLVVLGASILFNPTLDTNEIDRQLAADYEKASAEYLSEWRDDLTNFLDRQLVEDAVDTGITVRPRNRKRRHIAFADPSGGRGDSFTCAVAHAEDDKVILDYLYERPAPFDPETVVKEISGVLKGYGLSSVEGDRYAAEWVSGAFSKVGIRYTESERDKSQIFLDALPLFTSGRARILQNQRLIHQLISLERRTTRIGRDIVSHPDHANAHDDAANAVCGAMTLAADTKRLPIKITPGMLQQARRMIRHPRYPGRFGRNRTPKAVPLS